MTCSSAPQVRASAIRSTSGLVRSEICSAISMSAREGRIRSSAIVSPREIRKQPRQPRSWGWRGSGSTLRGKERRYGKTRTRHDRSCSLGAVVVRMTGTIALRTRRSRHPQRRQWLCNRSTEDMPFLETVVGAIAALLSSLSYIPQVKKVWSGQPTDDLSSRTLIALTSGLVLWVAYGAIKADWIIVAANLVGASLTGFVLYHKLRERDRSRGHGTPDRA